MVDVFFCLCLNVCSRPKAMVNVYREFSTDVLLMGIQVNSTQRVELHQRNHPQPSQAGGVIPVTKIP